MTCPLLTGFSNAAYSQKECVREDCPIWIQDISIKGSCVEWRQCSIKDIADSLRAIAAK